MITIQAKIEDEHVLKALKFCGVYKSQERATGGYTHHWIAVWGDHRLYAEDEAGAWNHFDNLKRDFPDK